MGINKTMMRKIKKALISVSDKKDLKTYAEAYLCESKEWKSIDEVATYFYKNPLF